MCAVQGDCLVLPGRYGLESLEGRAAALFEPEAGQQGSAERACPDHEARVRMTDECRLIEAKSLAEGGYNGVVEERPSLRDDGKDQFTAAGHI